MLDFLRGRSLKTEVLQENGKVFRDMVTYVLSELRRQKVWSEPRVRVEGGGGGGDDAAVKQVTRILLERGATVVEDGAEVVVQARGGIPSLTERHSLRSVFPTFPGKMRVHRAGTPDSYDFDVDADKAPVIAPARSGRRVSNQYVVDLQRFNEWPTVADYVIEESEEAEEVKQEERSSVKRIQTAQPVSKVRGDLGTAKRAKTDAAAAVAAITAPGRSIVQLVPEASTATPVVVASFAVAAQQVKLVIPSSAEWFSMVEISQQEREALPEFFSGADPLKTPQTYKDYRDFMICAYWQNPSQYLSYTACRRNLVGDVCAILRVHQFLDQRGLINHQVTSLTVPTALPPVSGFQSSSSSSSSSASSAAVASALPLATLDSQQSDDGSGWMSGQTLRLLGAIEQYGDDWVRVANSVGEGKTPHDCVLQFIRMPGLGAPSRPELPMDNTAGLLAYLAAVLPPEIARGAAAAAAAHLRKISGDEAGSDDPRALAAVALAAAGERAGKLAEAEKANVGFALGKAVGLLVKGLHARLERFEELERHVVQKRDNLRRETLALLARSTQVKHEQNQK